MMGRSLRVFLGGLLIVLIAGCGANLRFSQATPEAKNFHPKRIAVFPVDVKVYPEAGGVIDPIIAGVLAERGWFTDVVSAASVIKRLGSNEDFKKVLTEYLSKLQTVNFSDPELSRAIGKNLSVEAFVIAQVDYWNYAVESDNKVAKAGISFRLVDAETGKIVWKSSHDETREYKFFKPALPDVARSVARDMISLMPH